MFYKMQGNEMVFQLANLEVREDFAIWDNKSQMYLKRMDGVANMDDLRFMKAAMFQQEYPNMRKVTQYIREIIIPQGNLKTQYTFGFKKTANDDLTKSIQLCRSLGVNPLEIEYIFRKIGFGRGTTHEVVAGQKVGLPQNVQSSQNLVEIPITLEHANKQYNVVELQKVPITAPNSPTTPSQQGFELPKSQAEVPDKDEMQVIEWANNYQDKLTEQQFIEGFDHSLKKNFNKVVADERARKWFYQYYQKK